MDAVSLRLAALHYERRSIYSAWHRVTAQRRSRQRLAADKWFQSSTKGAETVVVAAATVADAVRVRTPRPTKVVGTAPRRKGCVVRSTHRVRRRWTKWTRRRRGTGAKLARRSTGRQASTRDTRQLRRRKKRRLRMCTNLSSVLRWTKFFDARPLSSHLRTTPRTKSPPADAAPRVTPDAAPGVSAYRRFAFDLQARIRSAAKRQAASGTQPAARTVHSNADFRWCRPARKEAATCSHMSWKRRDRISKHIARVVAAVVGARRHAYKPLRAAQRARCLHYGTVRDVSVHEKLMHSASSPNSPELRPPRTRPRAGPVARTAKTLETIPIDQQSSAGTSAETYATGLCESFNASSCTGSCCDRCV